MIEGVVPMEISLHAESRNLDSISNESIEKQAKEFRGSVMEIILGNESIEEREHQLTNLLQEFGVPVDTWKLENGTKRVQDLMEEIESGETQLVLNQEGKIVREVNIVTAKIYALDPESDELYELTEDHQILPNGTRVERNTGVGMSEKYGAGRNENPKNGLIRGMEEELNLNEDSYMITSGPDLDIIEKQTKSYPGLHGRQKIVRYNLSVQEGVFAKTRENGFVETKNYTSKGKVLEKKVVFNWHKAKN